VCTGTRLNVVQDHDAGPLLGYFGQRLNFGSYSVREEVDARDSNWVLVTGQLGVWSRALGTLGPSVVMPCVVGPPLVGEAFSAVLCHVDRQEGAVVVANLPT